METEKCNKYENGKIYSIRSPNIELFYIGSTCQPLSKRFYEHKRAFKSRTYKSDKMASFNVIFWGDSYIELLENHPCKSREELLKREGEYIRKHWNEVYNKKVEGGSRKIQEQKAK